MWKLCFCQFVFPGQAPIAWSMISLQLVSQINFWHIQSGFFNCSPLKMTKCQTHRKLWHFEIFLWYLLALRTFRYKLLKKNHTVWSFSGKIEIHSTPVSEIDSVPHTSVRLCHWSDRNIGVKVRRYFPVLEKEIIVKNMSNRRMLMSVNKTEATWMAILKLSIYIQNSI